MTFQDSNSPEAPLLAAWRLKLKSSSSPIWSLVLSLDIDMADQVRGYGVCDAHNYFGEESCSSVTECRNMLLGFLVQHSPGSVIVDYPPQTWVQSRITGTRVNWTTWWDASMGLGTGVQKPSTVKAEIHWFKAPSSICFWAQPLPKSLGQG